MKTKKITALALSSMLLLSGCGGKTVDGKSIAASTSISNISADTLYDQLSKGTSGKNALFSYVLDQLIDQKFPATDDMKKNAEDTYNQVLNSYTQQYGDEDTAKKQLETALKSSGSYKSIDDYKKRLVYSMQYAEMMKSYIKKHFNTVFDDYYKIASPRKVSIIAVSAADPTNPTADEKANLKEVQDLLKEGQDFGTVAKKYSTDTNTKDAKGSLGIVDSTSSLSDTYGTDVQSKATELKSGETSDVITGSSAFYILHCDSTDKETIKKELKSVDINSPLITYDNYLVYIVFNSYKINYNDKTIKNTLQSFIKEQLKKRSDERKDS